MYLILKQYVHCFKHLQTIFLIFLISFSSTNSSIYEAEERVNSEGMWQKSLPLLNETASKEQGNSRFDVGGLLSAVGSNKGSKTSILGMVVLPFVFPVIAIFAAALFIISLFGGTNPLLAAATGRRFDADGSGNNVLSSISATSAILQREQCLERIGCELLERVGHKPKKILRLLRRLNFLPEKLDIAFTSGKPCVTAFRCDLRDRLSRSWKRSYAKYFT